MKRGFNKHIIPRGRSAVRDHLKEHGEVTVSAFSGAHGLTYTGPVKPANPAGPSVLYRVRVKLVSMEDRKKKKLSAQGYAVTSRKHRMVSRIDRPDWREHMAQSACPWDAKGEGMAWVAALGRAGAADHYRRCYSKDRITLRFSPGPKFPKSATGPEEYMAAD